MQRLITEAETVLKHAINQNAKKVRSGIQTPDSIHFPVRNVILTLEAVKAPARNLNINGADEPYKSILVFLTTAKVLICEKEKY